MRKQRLLRLIAVSSAPSRHYALILESLAFAGSFAGYFCVDISPVPNDSRP